MKPILFCLLIILFLIQYSYAYNNTISELDIKEMDKMEYLENRVEYQEQEIKKIHKNMEMLNLIVDFLIKEYLDMDESMYKLREQINPKTKPNIFKLLYHIFFLDINQQ